MAADFFARQDAARRNTTRLVVLFVMAVLAIMASIHLLLGMTLGVLAPEHAAGGVDWTRLADPGLLAVAVGGTLLVVGGGSLTKIAQLRGGGRVIAEELGGRLITPDTTIPAERQLLNVVEEMAIASGTPTPPVYLLEQEDGINAFAAGFDPTDAVIGVTRGTAELLTRDELQGVIAHEFSHILNGDMRLNVRLIGVLHGILIVGILGHFIFRAAAFSGRGRSRSRRDGNPLPLIALGAGLMAIGFLGTLFGNLIKAAVSRQREFLADASAVQFTRLPAGLAGALKKIGAAATGSTLRSPNAPEASHLFFGRATTGLSGLFSTHPPLRARILRIDPSWDGTLPVMEPAAGRAAGPASALPSEVHAALGPTAAEPMPVHRELAVTRAVDHIGQPGHAHLQHAARLVRNVPADLVRAAHEPYGARAVVYALLLDREAGRRQAQLAHLMSAADPGVYQETLRLAPGMRELGVRLRLPLVEMALPALRALTTAEHERFKRNVAVLVEADQAMDLFEWSLQRILMRDLEAHRGHGPPSRVRHHRVDHVQPACEVLLSALAHAGHREPDAVRTAFDRGWQQLGLTPARLRPAEECGLGALDTALSALDEAAPAVKRAVLRAGVACITADGVVRASEAELLRAVAASLHCPMPPVLTGNQLS